MTSATLIGFSDNEFNPMTATLAVNGYKVDRNKRVAEIQPDEVTFVSGDRANSLETVRQIRAVHPRAFLVVVTRLPDSDKWLDALEAGADDYCSMPLDKRQIQWLSRLNTQVGSPASARVAGGI